MTTTTDGSPSSDLDICDANDPDDPGHTPTSLATEVEGLLAGAGTVRLTGRLTGPFVPHSLPGGGLGPLHDARRRR